MSGIGLLDDVSDISHDLDEFPSPHATRRFNAWSMAVVAGALAWLIAVGIIALEGNRQARAEAEREKLCAVLIDSPAGIQWKDAPAGEACVGGIPFVRNPLDAFKQARQRKKLVFMLHVSGDFEDPAFT